MGGLQEYFIWHKAAATTAILVRMSCIYVIMSDKEPDWWINPILKYSLTYLTRISETFCSYFANTAIYDYVSRRGWSVGNLSVVVLLSNQTLLSNRQKDMSKPI